MIIQSFLTIKKCSTINTIAKIYLKIWWDFMWLLQYDYSTIKSAIWILLRVVMVETEHNLTTLDEGPIQSLNKAT